MYKTVKNISEYTKKCDVSKLPIDYRKMIEKRIFGKNVKLYDNEWLWHLHLKCTDICNADCEFCVERSCRNNDGNEEKFLENTEKMLSEMEREGILYSVSVTGGEPTLFPALSELLNILKKHDIRFLTMNTNGALLQKYQNKINGLFDFIDISRHSFDDKENNRIFKAKVLSVDDLMNLKSSLPGTKIRIQCVTKTIDSIKKMLKFIKRFSFADDISFRRLMNLGEEFGVDYKVNDKQYENFLDYAIKNWSFKEQTIQDYYVYEIYNNGKTDITFSYSDMKMLRKVEKEEPEDIFREFIIHPDGVVSGSWKKDCKILLE